MNLFDTHCHLDLEDFDPDRDDVIERAHVAGVDRLLIPAVNHESWDKILRIANNYDNVYVALGIQPNSADDWKPCFLEELKNLINADDNNKIKAIGEIGLDNYWKRVDFNTQVEVLKAQLGLASETGLPIILHSREENNSRQGLCSESFLKILKDWLEYLPPEHIIKKNPGVFHSFSGDIALVKELLPLGFYFGISGSVTFKNAEINREVVKFIPSDRLLIETDSPYLSPVPFRGRRNEPVFVTKIAEKIAEILNTNSEQIAEQTTSNARNLFLGEDPFE